MLENPYKTLIFATKNAIKYQNIGKHHQTPPFDAWDWRGDRQEPAGARKQSQNTNLTCFGESKYYSKSKLL